MRLIFKKVILLSGRVNVRSSEINNKKLLIEFLSHLFLNCLRIQFFVPQYMKSGFSQQYVVALWFAYVYSEGIGPMFGVEYLFSFVEIAFNRCLNPLQKNNKGPTRLTRNESRVRVYAHVKFTQREKRGAEGGSSMSGCIVSQIRCETHVLYAALPRASFYCHSRRYALKNMGKVRGKKKFLQE